MHLHDERNAVDGADRRDVTDEIVVGPVIKRRVDRVRCVSHQERIAVGRRVHDRLGADIAAGARAVVDDELVTELVRQPLRNEARRDVDRAGGRSADNQSHRPGRIGLRSCDPRCRRKRDHAGR